MTQDSHVESILHQISLDKKQLDADKGVDSFYIISGHNGPRWIIPKNPKQGLQVLADWRPYGLVSQIAWFALRTLYSLGAATLMPGVKRLTIKAAVRLKLPNSNATISPVIYVGTPGPQQKAVVTLMDVNSGKALAVMKIALENGAKESLKHEADTLKLLKQLEIECVPKLIAEDNENGRIWQTVVSGCLSPRKLTSDHINWLLTLPKSKKTSTLDKQKAILFSLLEQEKESLSTEQLSYLNLAIETLNGQHDFSLVFVHGDFAPWNIKQQQNGQLAVIDWEDAERDGLPLWDLCHFYFMQAHLFAEPNPLGALLTGTLVEQYLQGMPINSVEKMNFVLLYLLGTVLNSELNSSKEYNAFLIVQINRLLSQ